MSKQVRGRVILCGAHCVNPYIYGPLVMPGGQQEVFSIVTGIFKSFVIRFQFELTDEINGYHLHTINPIKIFVIIVKSDHLTQIIY